MISSENNILKGDVVELVDTCDSNSHAEKRNGSSPFIPTKHL